jgi:hypothetical protein
VGINNMPAGRPKGSKNQQSKITSLAAKYDLMPLDYMLRVLNHENTTDEDGTEADDNVTTAMRMDAAKSAAPYIHARLQSVTVQEKPYEGDPNSISNEYLAGVIARGSGLDDAAEEESGRVTH